MTTPETENLILRLVGDMSTRLAKIDERTMEMHGRQAVTSEQVRGIAEKLDDHISKTDEKLGKHGGDINTLKEHRAYMLGGSAVVSLVVTFLAKYGIGIVK